MRYFFAIAASVCLAATLAAHADTLDGIAVVVNDSVITYLQVQEAIAQEVETYRTVYQHDPVTFREKTLKLQSDEIEALTDARLILDDFNNGGYATNVLEHVINDLIKQDIDHSYGGDRSRLIKTLQAEGISYETYRKTQREKFIIGYMQDQHKTDSRKILISPLKIQTYYNTHPDEFKVEEQVKLRMIPLPPGTPKEVADEILHKIDGGVPFAEMAAVYGSGSYRTSGGDRGWVSRKEYNDQLVKVMFSLKPGEHSPVVEMRDERTGASTYYLLMVDDIRPAHVSSLSEVQAEIEQTLKNKEAQERQRAWILRLRSKSHIETY